MAECVNKNYNRISVVIPAINEINNLRKLIPYLTGLHHNGDIEIIIAFADDNPNSYSELGRYEGLQLIHCQKLCRAHQLNCGAEKATGEVLAFLHADVWPPETFFIRIYNAINSGYHAGLFSYRFNSDNYLLKLNASFTGKDGIFTGGGDQCLFIISEAFEAMGRFNENQVIMEDFEFFSRLRKSQYNYTIIKEDLIVSARKYENNSYLRVNLSNLLLVLLFKFKYPPQKLKSLHNSLLRLPHLERT